VIAMSKKALFLILGAFAVVLAGALAHVEARLRLIHVGYALGEKMQERRELEEEQRKLLLEEAVLRSPERVEKLARDKLGMVRPDAARIRVVRPGVRELAAR
jgi:cell division protein FtsL